MVFLLVLSAMDGSRSLPLSAWFVLVLFGFYGVAQTHGSLSLITRRAVTQYLETTGHSAQPASWPASSTTVTQLEVGRHYNDRASEKPRYFHSPPESPGFVTCKPALALHPMVHPIMWSPWSGIPICWRRYVPDQLGCWLPPFHRQLEVQVSSGAGSR